MPDTPKTPPQWLIAGIGRVRTALDFASRSAVPPNVALLEIAQGAWLTQALYVAVKLGIADALRDLEMLVHAGGRERTAGEYRDLLSRAGFRLTRVILTAGPMSIVEAVPASS